MMKITPTVLCLLFGFQLCQGKVLQLTQNNIEEMVAGKTVFIKFFAPWCGHCKAMAEDWEKLAAEWEGHPVGLVAEVDCTDPEGGESLCSDFEVQGFPTIMYGDPSSPEQYEGGRDYESLSAFAKENISKPVCSVANLSLCPEEAQTAINELLKKSVEDLEKVVADVDEKIAAHQTAFDEELEKLNEQYQKMVEEKDQKDTEVRTSNNIKYVKQVLASMKKDKGSDMDEL